jgi:hypothetical protein
LSCPAHTAIGSSPAQILAQPHQGHVPQTGAFLNRLQEELGKLGNGE